MTAAPGPTATCGDRTRRVVVLLTIVTLWLLATALVWLPIPTLGGVGLVMSAMWWMALIGLVVGLGTAFLGRRTTRLVSWVTVLLASCLLNWSCLAPGLWFETHRWLYDHAAASTSPGSSYYGSELPFWLRPLTVDGRVSTDGTALFFPQWIGIPDDAGGYLHSPGEPPDGVDLYGSLCRDPVGLSDGWWMCGM